MSVPQAIPKSSPGSPSIRSRLPSDNFDKSLFRSYFSSTAKPFMRLSKKRYRFMATLSLVIHVIGASWVLWLLTRGDGSWNRSMKFFRKLLRLDDPENPHEHNEHNVLFVWMCAIQARYIVTDLFAVYQATVNRRLLWTTVSTHLIEGWMCAAFFLGHSILLGERDCFVFGLTCMLWTLMWFGAYVALDYDNMAVELRRIKSYRKRVGEKVGTRVNAILRRPSESDLETSASELDNDSDSSLAPTRRSRRKPPKKTKRS